jgi:hypothetical protein
VLEALTKEFDIKVVPFGEQLSNGAVMFFRDGLVSTVELRQK